jgi:hypothetical protein
MSGSTPETPELVKLALAKFGQLSTSELNVVGAATSGGFAFCGPSARGDDPANDPAQAAGWSDDRSVRAALIRWICADRTAKELVDPHGLWIHAARIVDMLDLASVTVPFPLIFDNCLFASAIVLLDSRLETLYLRRSQTVAVLIAVGLMVRSDLLFQNGNAEEVVRLRGASIGGNLLCDEQTFQKGLQAAGMRTSGSVSLRGASIPAGGVELSGAAIGGNLECDKGTFKNAGGAALSADGLKVGGNLFLRGGFNAVGEVRLIRAEIGATFGCDTGTFKNAGGIAPLRRRYQGGWRRVSAAWL